LPASHRPPSHADSGISGLVVPRSPLVALMCYRLCSRAVTPVSRESFSFDCCSGPRQRTLWTAKPEEPCDIPRRRRPRRQVRGGIDQAFCGLGIQSPRQHHPRRSGRDEDRKGLAIVLCGSRGRRPAGWGAELVAVAVPRQAQHTGVQPVCPIVRAEPVSDGHSACTGLRRLIMITEVSAACQASSQADSAGRSGHEPG
jgi:hypothetical protein